jgi:hypothetical protein
MKAQRLQITQALLRIAADVTPNDRTECSKALDISKQTICYYLNGKVTNNDKALRVLEFFINRINNRQQEIKQLCP